jgi:multiple sugar transport system substrate-binding protein
MRKSSRAALVLGSLALTSSVLLSGCTAPSSGGGQPAAAVSQEDIDTAMSTPTELTFWTWVPDIQNEIDLFEKKYPEISVTVENVGQGSPHYQKIRSAVLAGEGAPDVVQMEYQYIPSFTVTDSLLDLAPYGAGELEEDYVPWVWNQVSRDDVVYSLPQDVGPMGNLYRSDLLAQAGITEPAATWEQYAADAKTVKDATGSYISNLAASEPSQFVGLLWQAGAKPFAYDGAETVGIDVNSDEAKKVAEYWQGLIQQDLVSVDPGFNDQWYQAVSSGKYAGWLTAAWAPIFLEGTAADTAGKWSAAPLPQWQEGDSVSGNWGGSSDAVLASSENPIAAYELVEFLNHDPESTSKLALEQSLFPPSNEVLESPDFTGQESAFFGGQTVNADFAEISTTVDTEFEWLPFMDYAYDSWTNTVGKAIADKGDMVGALDAWQEQLETYSADQGFTVE